jgi:hypothetical protein
MVRTGATFADAAADFLRYVEHDRDCKPSTLRNYRSVVEAHLVPAFGDERVEDVTAAMIEDWRASLGGSLSSRTKNKLLVVLHGVFRRAQSVYGLPLNPVAGLEKHRQRRRVRGSSDRRSRRPAWSRPLSASSRHRRSRRRRSATHQCVLRDRDLDVLGRRDPRESALPRPVRRR